ncbi:MAG: hypothetical protein WCI91_01740 [Candidatus Nomurabacteria bacterium]
MRAHIKKLQSKSEDTRKLIFVGAMIVCMSFVSLVWIYGLGVRFGNPEVKQQADEDIKPFKLFSDSISSTYKSVSASVGKISLKQDPIVTTDKQIDLIPKDNTNQTQNEQVNLTPTDNTVQISDKQVDLIPVENTNQ